MRRRLQSAAFAGKSRNGPVRGLPGLLKYVNLDKLKASDLGMARGRAQVARMAGEGGALAAIDPHGPVRPGDVPMLPHPFTEGGTLMTISGRSVSIRHALIPLVLTAWLTVGLPAGALAVEKSTMCTGSEVLEINPGLSLSTGTVGTVENAGVKGAEDCDGPAGGYEATGPIRTEHHIRYGLGDPDTCREVQMVGYAVHFIPTKDGIVEVRNDFTADVGTFTGKKFSGYYTVTPLKGDCVSAPLTRFRADWVGTWNAGH